MKQAMELKAAFSTSCEQPGFTIIFTCHKRYVQEQFTIHHDEMKFKRLLSKFLATANIEKINDENCVLC